MNCGQIKKSLIAFLEDELSAGERVVVEAHLRQCEGCQKEKTILADAWKALEGLPVPAVSHDFTANLMTKIHALEAKKPWWHIAFPEIPIPFAFPRLVPALVSICLVAAVCLPTAYFLTKRIKSGKELPALKKVGVQTGNNVPHEVAAQVAGAKILKTDEEIIRHLNVYENIEMLQNYVLLKDFEAVQNLKGKGL